MLPFFFIVPSVELPAIIESGFAENVPPPMYARLDFENLDVFA